MTNHPAQQVLSCLFPRLQGVPWPWQPTDGSQPSLPHLNDGPLSVVSWGTEQQDLQSHLNLFMADFSWFLWIVWSWVNSLVVAACHSLSFVFCIFIPIFWWIYIAMTVCCLPFHLHSEMDCHGFFQPHSWKNLQFSLKLFSFLKPLSWRPYLCFIEIHIFLFLFFNNLSVINSFSCQVSYPSLASLAAGVLPAGKGKGSFPHTVFSGFV